MGRLCWALLVALGISAPALADTLEQVRETGVFSIGFRQDAPPFAYLASEGGPAGYSVELCRHVAEAVGTEVGNEDLTIEFHPVTAANRFDALRNGEIDILCGATTVTLDRRAEMDFSILTFVTGSALLAPQDAPVDTLDEVDGKRIGVLGGTTTEALLRDSLAASGVDADIAVFERRPQGLDALLAGEIDAFFGDRVLLLGLVLALDSPGALTLSDRYLSVEPYALALRRGDDALRLVVDRTLARLYRDSGIGEIFAAAFPNVAQGELIEILYILHAFRE